MPPHGRRRFSTLTIVLSCLLFFASTASAAQAVLGIDLGTEYIKAALVKPGVPLDIVLTKDSKRKETAALAFKSIKTKVNTLVDESFPERIYGGDAVALSARFPGDVFPNLKPLLGLGPKDDVALEYSKWRPELQLVESKETGTVGFKSDSFVKEEEAFLVEELLAMELKNVKSNAKTMAGKGYAIQDVVITVPPFYTVEERRAVTAAAELAGLRVLSLISDGLAVGLNYATSRTFPVVNEGGKPEIHLVYDMGAGSTTATLLKFQGKVVKDVGKYNKTIQEVQVLSTGWDRTLGGDALNGLIVDDMIVKILESNHMKNLGLTSENIKSHGRTMAKLWKEAERLRQVLSANTETQTTMEGLYYEDFNFKYKFKRSDFENLATAFAGKVINPISDALDAAKLSLSDLESVILHGGAVRTPFVQKRLEETVKNSEKIRTNVNSDEAAVFGAAFKAATISPSFRVKEIRVSDTAVYPVHVSWSIDGKDRQQKLFVPTSQVGAEKQFSFKNTDDFSFELYQTTPQGPQTLPVISVKTQNLTESVKQLNKLGCESTEINPRFGIRISPVDGLPEVVGGSISCEITESKKSGGVVDGVKDFLGFGSKKDAQEPLKEEVESDATTASSEASSPTSKSQTSSTSTTESNSSAEAESSSSVAKEPKKKIETINIDLSVTKTGSYRISPDHLTKIKTRLTAFDASDRGRALREEALNTLEGYTYKIRDILEDEAIVEVSTPAQREEIEQKSNDASNWIYGDGAEANQAALKGKLDELRALVNPIVKRKEEKVKRPVEFQKLRDALLQAGSMVDLIKNQVQAQSSSESEKSASMSSSLEAESSSITDTSTAETSTTTVDDFADLDDETSTTTATTTASPSPSSEPALPTYSKEDLDSITEKENSAKAWLDEKLALQEKLGPTDEPVVLSSEIAAKSKELNDAVMDVIMRTMKMPKSGGGTGGGKKPKGSGKKSKSKKEPSAVTIDVAKAASSASSSSDSTPEEPKATDFGAWGSAPNDAKPPLEEFEGMEGMKVSLEDLDEAMKQQEEQKQKESGESSSEKSSGEKSSKKKTDTKPKTKGKVKTKKGSPKGKKKNGGGKPKKAKEEHSEL